MGDAGQEAGEVAEEVARGLLRAQLERHAGRLHDDPLRQGGLRPCSAALAPRSETEAGARNAGGRASDKMHSEWCYVAGCCQLNDGSGGHILIRRSSLGVSLVRGQVGAASRPEKKLQALHTAEPTAGEGGMSSMRRSQARHACARASRPQASRLACAQVFGASRQGEHESGGTEMAACSCRLMTEPSNLVMHCAICHTRLERYASTVPGGTGRASDLGGSAREHKIQEVRDAARLVQAQLRGCAGVQRLGPAHGHQHHVLTYCLAQTTPP